LIGAAEIFIGRKGKEGWGEGNVGERTFSFMVDGRWWMVHGAWKEQKQILYQKRTAQILYMEYKWLEFNCLNSGIFFGG
jgi:hypothetical protein